MHDCDLIFLAAIDYKIFYNENFQIYGIISMQSLTHLQFNFLTYSVLSSKLSQLRELLDSGIVSLHHAQYSPLSQR